MALSKIKNNPAFLTESELVAFFVVRLADLELIMETIRENDSNTNQHIIIIGPRGMGKTMLVLRVAAEVQRMPYLIPSGTRLFLVKRVMKFQHS